MRILESRLLRRAAGTEGFPRGGLPEIAFVGRSNVGKSNLLNALVGRRGLARTSRRPGCTQLVHFYLLNRKLLFADLPGYGYAKVPEAVRRSWGPLAESYLDSRKSLRLVWVLVDSRHSPTELDAQLVEWLRAQDMPFRVAMTKADQVRRSQRAESLRRCVDVLGLEGENWQPLLTSAKDRSGLAAVWKEIRMSLEEDSQPSVLVDGKKDNPMAPAPSS